MYAYNTYMCIYIYFYIYLYICIYGPKPSRKNDIYLYICINMCLHAHAHMHTHYGGCTQKTLDRIPLPRKASLSTEADSERGRTFRQLYGIPDREQSDQSGSPIGSKHKSWHERSHWHKTKQAKPPTQGSPPKTGATKFRGDPPSRWYPRYPHATQWKRACSCRHSKDPPSASGRGGKLAASAPDRLRAAQ